MSDRPSINRQILNSYVRASWNNRREALLAMLNPVGAIFTNIGVPFFAGKALVSSIRHDANFGHYLFWLIVVSILGSIANRLGFINLMILQAKTMSDLQNMAFSRLLRRGVSFHTNRIGGKMVSDTIDFVSAYGVLVSALFNSAISLLAVLLIGLIVVTVSSWQLGIFVSITVLITLVWAYLESLKRTELRHVRLVATKNLTGHLSDSIVNAQTVKTFAGEEYEITENKRLNAVLRDLRIRDWRRAGVSGNNRSVSLLILLIGLIVLIHAVSSDNPNTLSTGIFAFTYTFTLLLRLFDINTITRQIEESFLQASPMIAILEQVDEVVDQPDAKKLVVSRGAIDFTKVGFHYTEATGEQNVFETLNLHIQAGEKVGIVGPSGGGKTTLTRLLLRFEDIQSGTISIDNQDIAAVTQTSLRQHIAYVPQEALLFHRSIAANISYGQPSVDTNAIKKAATLAYADEFIRTLPKGYETVVGERGVKLSGGQRQRVAIARAILKDAPILVLDEATSALDSESEVAIQAALGELMQGRTTLVIAHRLSTIQKMDRIIVLNHGKIVEEGTHHELIAKKGLYAKLWAHQSGGFIED